ncbi:unnamed protein product [Kuraishia capsulata CBS 1993]|uniref:Uncharacterized protein n=1 Tax=Kuraishia capsulata CBS 1993 TaxID=1382522 RepID=W6MY11_9ASCO|nr:uncharacterized protein KUCA_T00005819001 [Kuraishia capsulata CBS 1993]CDK29825.1 unnamed protein product [Kuraishia capsulata CBS 1993]
MSDLSPVYSTGRGGHGNLTHAHEKSELEPSFSNSSKLSSAFKHDKEGNVTYSTGRGGAGNFKSSKEIPSPTLTPDPETGANSLQPVFSTGRGGFGNMVKSGDISPIASRDYSNPPNIKANAPVSTGRGGAGNVVDPTASSEQKSSNFLSKLKKIFN